STRFGETTQIHHVRAPGAARRQLTFYDEPVGGVNADLAGATFAFFKDEGGDEFYQGHLFDLETGEVTGFTEPGTRNADIRWSDDGARAVWARIRSGDPDFDIMVGDPRDPASIRVALE